MESIEGVVGYIVFRSQQTGYTVFELDQGKGAYQTCVGNITHIEEGEYVRLLGEKTLHPSYGEQFSVATMETALPQDAGMMKAFLAGGLLSGVGEILAGRIVDAFGERTFDVIEHSPEELAAVRGISAQAALRMQAQWKQSASIRWAMQELENLGLSPRQAMRAYETYGQAAGYLIQQNPYRLTEELGIGFARAEEIAQKFGVDQYADLRLKSGILHVLRSKMAEGSTCYPQKDILNESMALLKAAPEEMESALETAIQEGLIAQKEYNAVPALALGEMDRAEEYAAARLALLAKSNARHAVPPGIQTELLQGEMLSEEQKQAIRQAMEATVSVITGGPGTGKTTILNEILRILERSGMQVALAAPTGRAAKRMEHATGRPAKTLHRLLEYAYQEEKKTMQFGRNREHPLSQNAIIIDEMSMVDLQLFCHFLSAVRLGSRLIFIGDADQLPSVGPGNILKDLIAWKEMPVARLTHVFRQQGSIAEIAQRVNRGYKIPFPETGDYCFLSTHSLEETQRKTMDLYAAHLAAGEQTQILCPLKGGEIGVLQLNEQIRNRVNPQKEGMEELQMQGKHFRLGDQVMQMSNQYAKEWKAGPLEKGMGVFNGDMGEIAAIDARQGKLQIFFDDGRSAWYAAEEATQLELAYAITIHKSQGSEFDTVILPLYYFAHPFLSRNLLYTAITRAKKKLIVIGLSATVKEMIANARVQRRFSALKYHLARFSALSSDALAEEEFSKEQAFYAGFSGQERL